MAREERGFLTPLEARTLLGVSRTYLRDLGKKGRLTTFADERGVHRYSRAEVLALARRRHVRVADVKADKAAMVFQFFEDGYSLPAIVIQCGMHPETVRELYKEYKRPLDGETAEDHAARLAKDDAAHEKRMAALDRDLEKKMRRRTG
jgi:hypothetical protein